MTVPRPCTSANPSAIRAALAQALQAGGLTDDLTTTHPHLFSTCRIEIPERDLAAMHDTIAAVEAVMAMPAWQLQVLGESAHDPHCRGVFFGYDFHLTPQGPRLIEINTNAGGALLMLAILRAHLECEPSFRTRLPLPLGIEGLEQQFVEMFREEWRLARGEMPLTRIAIADDDAAHQFLHPEFVLFRDLFRRHGIDAVIADATAFEVRDSRLRSAGQPVDLVYNRVTDFTLTEPQHTALREAYLDNLAVITPHPRAHALYAHKRNLAWLTQEDELIKLGVASPVRAALLSGIARTRLVRAEDADELWTTRKQLFFKPVAGFGSKAVYRGDKLTKRVWEEIRASNYVAQELAPPDETLHDESQTLKYDLRCFVYAGEIQLLAARLYQGQTTNFRTPGGGFAPVFTVTR